MTGGTCGRARFCAGKEWTFERMNNSKHRFDVLVVGAGPAGIAAACCAAECGARVGLVDNNARPGGQIWRGKSQDSRVAEAGNWLRKLAAARVEILPAMEVFAQQCAGRLVAESLDGVSELSYKKLILCTGARERFLPFPGWTLPNVLGAGGLQALAQSGLSIAGKKVVVAVTAHLSEHGADVRLIAEQTPWGRLIRFGLAL